MNKKISLAMPVYNGAATIEKIVDSYHKEIIQKLRGSEFIIAEDGSTDGTKEILKRLSKKYSLRLIIGKERKGYAKAMKDVLQTTRNEIVFFSDSDGEHTPKDFWKLMKRIDHFDVVIGYKQKRKPFYRFLISKVNNAIISLFFGIRLKDGNCGFRLIRKGVVDDIIDDVKIMNHTPSLEFALRAHKKGYKIIQVPVRHNETKSAVFPIKKIPKVIINELYDIIRLKKEL